MSGGGQALSRTGGFALIVMLALFLVSCGGSNRSSPDVDSVETNTPAPVTDTAPPADRSTEAVGPDSGGGGGGDPLDTGDYAWWVDPETGQEGWIVEGYASIGLEYFPEWVFDPPVDAEAMNDEFVNRPTIQALQQLGYELLMPYGVVMAGEFKLPEGMTFAQARAALMPQFPDIWFVDPWPVPEFTSYPNDPWMYEGGGPVSWLYQWYFDNSEYPYDVNAPPGWSIQQGSDDTVIAHIDTGVDRNTPDLGSNRLTEYGWNMYWPYLYTMWNHLIVPGGGTPHPNIGDHGTHACSLMAASTDNSFQMAGGTWDGKVLPINMQREDNGDPAFQYISLSLYLLLGQVGLAYIPHVPCDYNVKVVNINVAHTVRNTLQTLLIWCLSFEAVVVAPAGNGGMSGNPMNFPAAAEPLSYESDPGIDALMSVRGDTVLAVTAFTSAGYKPWWASYYEPLYHSYNWVDVSAPGQYILTLAPPPDSYAIVNGTSASAPITSALVLLMFCEHPEMSAWEIHDAIESFTCDDPPLLDPRLPARIDYELALSLGGQ